MTFRSTGQHEVIYTFDKLLFWNNAINYGYRCMTDVKITTPSTHEHSMMYTKAIYTINCCLIRGPNLLTYLPTPWCRVLLEKITGLKLVKKFPAFYGTRRFITALTSVRHLSLSWASPIQSTYPHPTSWRSILILSTHLRLGLPSGFFPSGFPTKTLYANNPSL